MLREIRKFTPKAEVDRMLGEPVFQLEDRPAYYYGGGFVIHDSPVRFRVEGIRRAEYGETGEYAVGGYHFPDTGTLQMGLGLTQFEAGDMAPLWEDTVDGAVTYQSTFREIHRWAVLHAVEGCQEGETRQPVDGRMEFKRCWITWDRYEFYFYGRSGKTKAAGFRFAFPK